MPEKVSDLSGETEIVIDKDTADAGDNTEDKGFKPIESQEDLDRIIEKRLARERAKFADYEEVKAKAAKVDEIEEEKKSDLQRALDQIEALKAEAEQSKAAAAQAERAVLVEKVAASKGVPAKYLSGDSEDDLVASADAFLEDVSAIAKPSPSGYVPTAGTGDPKASVDEVQLAKERAAAYKV